MSNYYLVLGIDRDADIDKIKHAYRLYCKKYHPDLVPKDFSKSNEDKNNFLKIQEAYETLSDKEKRRIYDQSLEQHKGQIPVNFVNSGFWEKKIKKNQSFKIFTSIIDNFFEGFVSGFFEEDFSGDKELYLELILSPEESKNGGVFPVEVPVLEECPVCFGKGYFNKFICSRCDGTGNIHTKRSFNLHVPPNISSGFSTRVSLEGIGLKNIFINLEIVVSYIPYSAL